ncbi:MAG: glycosyltransferase [Bacteroidales bacterium]|nr:glycosyltransferase [Bacteroidales bacterium]
MKIVIVIDSWNKGNGGVVVTHTLVNELKLRGHEVSLVTTAGEEVSKYTGTVNEVSGFYIPGIKESLKSMGFCFGVGKKKVFRKAYKDADLVHVIFPFFMARNAVRVAKKMKIPVMGACHIQSQNLTGAMGKDSKVMDWFFNHWFNYQLFNRVKAIHCPSELAADLLRSKGTRSHFRVISNGIPREFFPMENAKRPDFFGDKFVIINIGRHAMEKKQETIIDAVLKSKYKDDIRLLICGRGETSARLIERGKELPVEPLVRYISEEEKHLFLNTADLYVHSSGVELESRSCMEAIGCGLPCLIENSPTSAASKFSLDERFLFKSGDIEEMAAKIDYWYENRTSLVKMKQPVLLMAEKYRIEKSIAAMEQLFQDVLNTHNGNNHLLPVGEKMNPYALEN